MATKKKITEGKSTYQALHRHGTMPLNLLQDSRELTLGEKTSAFVMEVLKLYCWCSHGYLTTAKISMAQNLGHIDKTKAESENSYGSAKVFHSVKKKQVGAWIHGLYKDLAGAI